MRPLFMTTVLAIGTGIISAANVSAQPIDGPPDDEAVSAGSLASPADYYVYRYRDDPYLYVERPYRYRYLYRDDDRPYRYHYAERPYRYRYLYRYRYAERPYRYLYRDDDRPYRYRYVERPHRYLYRDDDRPRCSFRCYEDRPYRAYRRPYWYQYD
jgi:hypothetical protein